MFFEDLCRYDNLNFTKNKYDHLLVTHLIAKKLLRLLHKNYGFD